MVTDEGLAVMTAVLHSLGGVGTFHTTGWMAPEGMTDEEWMATGRALAQMDQMRQAIIKAKRAAKH